MRTSVDVYHRLLHDTSLDLSEDTVIGYHDRFKGCMEIRLTKYATGGDIPWHRVLYFRHGEFLWHKATRLDLVFNSTNRAIAMEAEKIAVREADMSLARQNKLEMEEAARLKAWVSHRPRRSPTAFSRLEKAQVHVVSKVTGEWVALDSCAMGQSVGAEGLDLQQLSFNTLNVLSDFYLSEELSRLTKLRWSHIADCISNDLSQFWVFTEVTPEFVSFVLSRKFVKKWYRSSAGPATNFRSLPSHPGATGQLVLIRCDVACNSVCFTDTTRANGKRLTYLACTLPTGVTLSLCAVHLTSGQRDCLKSALAVNKRKHQLDQALKQLRSIEVNEQPCQLQVIVGDFNFKSAADDAACASLLEGFVEAGPNLWENTYAPAQNCLARLNGSGESMRLDRVYLKILETSSVQFAKAEVSSHGIFGTESFEVNPSMNLDVELDASDQLMISDHFGVRTTFSVGISLGPLDSFFGSKKTWTSATALALLPSEEHRQEIDEWIRLHKDPAAKRWPPHCNVLFPFVIPELIAPTLADIRDSMTLENFDGNQIELKFTSVSSFRHKTTSTIYLQCSAEERNQKLHDLAQASAERIAGPKPAAIATRARSNEFTPHLTLAKFRHGGETSVEDIVCETERQFKNIGRDRWNSVPHSMVILQKLGERMTVVEELRLRQPMGQASQRKRTLIALQSLCRRAFRGMSGFEIHPVGSSALFKGRDFVGDVHVVVIPPDLFRRMTPTEFASAVASVMAEAGNHSTRLAGDASTISVDMRESHSLLPIDILFGDTKYSTKAREDTQRQCRLLESLLAEQKLTMETFTVALSQVKLWAGKKMLTRRAYGLWSGIAWSIMVLAVGRTSRHDNARDLLLSFFAFYSQIDWTSHALTIDGLVSRESTSILDGRDCRKDGAIVVSASKGQGRANVIRGVSPTVAACVKTEIQNALQLLLHGTESLWLEYIGEQGYPVSKAYDSLVVVGFTFTMTNKFAIDLADIEGWLKGHFVLFSRAELGERGICVRPSSKLDVQTREDLVTAELICGIDEQFSRTKPADRSRLVAHAEKQLKDKFLRWDTRPDSSSLYVKLEHSK